MCHDSMVVAFGIRVELVSVTPRPEKGRHVATAACPRVGLSFPGSIQELARLVISTHYEPNSPLKIYN